MLKKYRILYVLLAVLSFSVCLLFWDTRLEGELMWIISKNTLGYKFYRYIYNNRIEEIESNVLNNMSFYDTTNNEKWILNDSLSNLKSSFIFTDEQSKDVLNLSHDIFPIPYNEKDWFLAHYINNYPLCSAEKSLNYTVSFENNGFYVVSDSLSNHWIYVVSKKEMPQKYAVEFDYYSETVISEQLQFDVFAHSLADR